MSQINRADFVPCFLRLFTEKETCVMPGETALEVGLVRRFGKLPR